MNERVLAAAESLRELWSVLLSEDTPLLPAQVKRNSLKNKP
jgi:hypothetical protein